MATYILDGVKQHGPSTVIEQPRERAILVGVTTVGQEWSTESSLDELGRLAWTAGCDEVARVSQRMDSPNPRTFIGSGKADEISALIRELSADVVIFDDELTPSQQGNLEKLFGKGVKVIDRTALILDIFALHATSKEGRLQVKLAQNQYLYPRLRGMWAHLASNRMGGGVGSRFGEGESQLEVDRRLIRNRITAIRKELKQISRTRELQRSNRYQSGIFKIALVGYTNAGKSSLLNALTDANVLSYDKLFATLDSTTRKMTLDEGRQVTLTDTVGFIQKLPHTLVEAFQSTLDEVCGADLLLHIIDATDENFIKQYDTVCNVLGDIGAASVNKIEVINKIDALDQETLTALKRRFPQALFVSAHEQTGFPELLNAISLAASAKDTLLHVCIPYDKGNLVALAHEQASLLREEYTEEGTVMTLRVPEALMPQFKPYEHELSS